MSGMWCFVIVNLANSLLLFLIANMWKKVSKNVLLLMILPRANFVKILSGEVHLMLVIKKTSVFYDSVVGLCDAIPFWSNLGGLFLCRSPFGEYLLMQGRSIED